jgi:hypothetical protein
MVEECNDKRVDVAYTTGEWGHFNKKDERGQTCGLGVIILGWLEWICTNVINSRLFQSYPTANFPAFPVTSWKFMLESKAYDEALIVQMSKFIWLLWI